MEPTQHVLTTADGWPIHYSVWTPDTVRGVVQVLHGLAEHRARYQGLAERLVAEGWAVYADDHRGHGESVRTEADRGHFADDDGWSKAVADVASIASLAREAHPDVPHVLLGHSMGSSLALTSLRRGVARWDGAVLSGPVGVAPTWKLWGGLQVARFERWRLGRTGTSALLEKLSFGDFNKPFPGRTDFDWLSKDEDEVDAYVNDPWCGHPATCQHWVDHLVAMYENGQEAQLAAMPDGLPMFVVAGTDDPVSAGTSQLPTLFERLRAGGVDVSHRFWQGGRHELFHELERDEVFEAVVGWLELQAGGAA